MEVPHWDEPFRAHFLPYALVDILSKLKSNWLSLLQKDSGAGCSSSVSRSSLLMSQVVAALQAWVRIPVSACGGGGKVLALPSKRPTWNYYRAIRK